MNKFWQRISLLNIILLPFGILYYFFSGVYQKIRFPYKAKELKVICVGNITMGGTGKTPFCVFLANLLKNKGKKIVFLTKGYKGKEQGPYFVHEKDNAQKVGDEALILARYGDVCVSKNRKAGLKFLENKGYEVVIMDDGLQNNSVYKDISFALIYSKFGLGNGLPLPAGPMREPLKKALKRVSLLIFMQGVEEKLLNVAQKQNKNYVEGKILPKLMPEFLEHKFLAFSGLGNNQKFFETLKEAKIKVLTTKEFKDHYSYRQKDIIELQNIAKEKTLKLITTEKDYVKIKNYKEAEGICILEISIEIIKNKDKLEILLNKVLG